MSLPSPTNIATDVWMIPCRIHPSGSFYTPLIRPVEPTDTLPAKYSRNSWKLEEEALLLKITTKHGANNWTGIAKEINSQVHYSKPVRSGKACREHWYNHLNPELHKSAWSEEEDKLILAKQRELGNHWSEIAKFLIGRNENQVKNRWNSLKKKAEELAKKERKERQRLKAKTQTKKQKSLQSREKGLKTIKIPIKIQDPDQSVEEDSSPVKTPATKQESFQSTEEELRAIKKSLKKQESYNSADENQHYFETEYQAAILQGLRRKSLEYLSNKQEEGSIALKISSLTSDPDLQSGKAFGLKDLYTWNSGKFDLDFMYNSCPVAEKSEMDSLLAHYLKTPESQFLSFDADYSKPYFSPENSEITPNKDSSKSFDLGNLSIFNSNTLNASNLYTKKN